MLATIHLFIPLTYPVPMLSSALQIHSQKPCSSSLRMHLTCLGILLKCSFWSVSLGQGLQFCISNKLPGKLLSRKASRNNQEQWFLTKGNFVPQEHLDYSETSLVIRTGLSECCMHAKMLQSCLTLCKLVDCSPPGSSVPGILQARILEWIAMPLSMDLPNQGIKLASLMYPALAGGLFTTSTTWKAQESVQFSSSLVSDSVTQRTAVHQASLSVTNSWSLLRLMSIESVMSSNHLILCLPLLLPSIFPCI